MWWTGMILMIVGELCNFIAYSFAPAILVTPLGALSVVISAVLSSIFLKERLTFQGKVGCVQCILGSVVIVLHAPEEGTSDTSIENFKHLIVSVGFLVYAGLAVVVSCVLVFFCAPRWGKTNMLVYISVCSLIGSLSVAFTQAFGASIIHSITISNQFTNWFIYLILALTIITLVLEVVYLNKALNLFNTAVVTPTYYVLFTTLTIVSSTVLYQGFDASGVDITTCIFGFLVICSGVALLHSSRSEQLDNDGTASIDSRAKMLPSNSYSYDNEKVSFEHHPGPADMFPKPFTGIGRYSSSTRRSIEQQYQRKTLDGEDRSTSVLVEEMRHHQDHHTNQYPLEALEIINIDPPNNNNNPSSHMKDPESKPSW
ncbi:magnesium transporter NIPA-domain-containing protein [Zychaea mexicana]|uniref:magnesium transporter NIPA-domain-containing protein n=1 Tax=Zychaea mexicana TaxID=64656 RepID=UPI0022FF164E|nr:magnesium transporter NIPA-domain-containing protein [Zychaea mexicana]KAI9498286.1 magnesium transporter NIPA-domain-containing protein [Zychaea mexicana]